MNGIYIIKNKINNKFYIGSTADLNGFKQRWKTHKRTLRKGTHYNDYLQKSWNKYGEAAFDFSILEVCEKEKCIEREQYYLNSLKPEYNICKTAGSTLGRKHSEETKKKISENRIYGEGWCKGRTDAHTKECKTRMSNSHKKSKVSQENVIKLNKSKRRPVVGTNIKTGEIVELEYMSQNPNFHGSGIRACIIGKNKTYKGFTWCFKQ